MALKKVKTKRIRKTAFKLTKATAPSNWAIYLLYGDASGMQADEIKLADKFVMEFGNGHAPVDVVDQGFMWLCDADTGLGDDVSEYVFLHRIGKLSKPFNVHGRKE